MDKREGGEFWKPQTKGEVILGRVADIHPGMYDDQVMSMSPVLLYPADGGPAKGYGSLNVGVNSWLDKLVDRSHIGKFIAIGYKGKRETKAGKQRVFAVYAIPEARVKEAFKQADAEELLTAPAKSVSAGPGMPEGSELYEEDDELPF